MEVDDETLGGFQITCAIEIEEVCCPVGAIADGANPFHAVPRQMCRGKCGAQPMPPTR
ncbi:hypothetical protein GCM10009823_04940 [Brevibacterium salitolerans]|uniref:Ferredoxin n=1 Tax=Brevibacterium salitolerans TaxID=1403566 RepID=A0ABN2WDN8_9MICO